MGRLTSPRRWPVAGLLAGLLLPLLAAPVSAVVLYSVVVTPMTATQWSPTNFSVSISNLNLLDDLGCLEFELPASFEILSVSVPVPSNGEEWVSRRVGQTILAHSDDGGGRLELGESVSFVIRARPQAAGAFTWPNHGHRDQDCGGLNLLGSPVAMTVLPGLAPTPLPTLVPTLPPSLAPSLLPSLAPSLLPTPKPTPHSTPLPTPVSTPGPTQRPDDGAATPAPPDRDPQPTPTPTPGVPTATPPEGFDAPASNDGDGGPVGSGPRPFAGPPEVRVGGAGTGGGVDVQVGPLGFLAGNGEWLVPAAVIGGPGLLVILFVVLQLAGALAWIPAVRRLRGEEHASR